MFSPVYKVVVTFSPVGLSLYPVPQNAPHVSTGMNVLDLPEVHRPKATDVSPWYGVYSSLPKNYAFSSFTKSANTRVPKRIVPERARQAIG